MGIVGDDSGKYSNEIYTLPNGDRVTGLIGISEEIRKKCFSLDINSGRWSVYSVLQAL
jgi:hypothetical protein